MQPLRDCRLSITSHPENSVILFSGNREIGTPLSPEFQQFSSQETMTHVNALHYLKDAQMNPRKLWSFEVKQFEVRHIEHPNHKTIRDIIKYYHQNFIRLNELETIPEIADFLNDLDPKLSISFWGMRLIQVGSETMSLKDLIERISFIAEKTKFVLDETLDDRAKKLPEKIRQFIQITDDLLQQENWFTRLVEWIRNHWEWTVGGSQPLPKVYEIMQSKLNTYP